MSPETQRIGTTDDGTETEDGEISVPRNGFEDVVGHLSLESEIEDPQARSRARRAIGDAYDYLAKYGTASERDLRWFYHPYTHAQESRGRYDSRRAWWSGVGREALLSLPGVSEGPNRQVRFTGVHGDVVGSTVPPDALDVSDDVHAAHVLNQTEWSKPRQREAVRDTWATLRSRGEMRDDDVRATLADHEGVHRIEHFWPSGRAVLADMPGIDVSRDGGTGSPDPDPTEIEVDTLADVLEGLRETGALDLETQTDHDRGETVWRAQD